MSFDKGCKRVLAHQKKNVTDFCVLTSTIVASRPAAGQISTCFDNCL